MATKAYQCFKCYLKFMLDDDEACSTCGAELKCPQCGSTEVSALPFDVKMLANYTELLRSGRLSFPRRG
jgi:hypothetical protein